MLTEGASGWDVRKLDSVGEVEAGELGTELFRRKVGELCDAEPCLGVELLEALGAAKRLLEDCEAVALCGRAVERVLLVLGLELDPLGLVLHVLVDCNDRCCENQ